jgi:hypothetical protein
VDAQRLREKRWRAAYRDLEAARAIVVLERRALAPLARDWRAATKRLGKAVARYELAVRDLPGFRELDFDPPRAIDFVRELGALIKDQQLVPLLELEETLKKQVKLLKRWELRSRKQREKRDKRRARKKRR